MRSEPSRRAVRSGREATSDAAKTERLWTDTDIMRRLNEEP